MDSHTDHTEEGKRRKQRIGFFGAYSYDIILYIARVLHLSGKRVLVIDRSTEQEVVRMIRTMDDRELQSGIFQFCGIDITARVVLPKDIGAERDYDVIIFDFGGNLCPEEYHSCDVICYVLDMYAHNALRIQEADNPENGERWMILRDLFRGKAMARYHLRLTGKQIEKEDTFSIRLNSEDFVARFRMETDQLPRVELAGEQMQETVYQLATRICPEIAGRKIKKGWRKKGEAEAFSA